MNEYERIDEILRQIWNDCIDELSYDIANKQQNDVLLDCAHSKTDEIMEIVAELEEERDQYKDKLDKIFSIANV